jgi:molybdopterin converting factor small subunit
MPCLTPDVARADTTNALSFEAMPEIRIPPVLRPEAGGERTVAVDGAQTVAEALEALVARYPGLRPRVLDDGGSVPSFLNVFVEGEDIRLLSGLDTSVEPATTILLLPAVAGGSRL